MKDVLYNEKNDFNEVTIKEDFIKLKKGNDIKIYYFDTIDLKNSFKTNIDNEFVEITILNENEEILFMIKKFNFLKFKEVINSIKRGYLNQDFSIDEKKYNPSDDDDCSPLYGVVSFFLPIVGFIIWIVLINTKPKSAKIAGICALIGFIINSIVCFFWYGPILFG